MATMTMTTLLCHLMETGMPVTLWELEQVVRADEAKYHALGNPSSPVVFHLEWFYRGLLAHLYDGRIIQLGQLEVRFDEKHPDVVMHLRQRRMFAEVRPEGW
jgi:hypothetical protein